MAEAKYNTAQHKHLRRLFGGWVAAGRGWCTEPVCIVERDGGTRFIPPGSEWHVPHNEDGVTYRGGPAHACCNTSEAATRGNRSRKQPKRRRIL